MPANDPSGSASTDWAQPDEALVREAVQMIGDVQLRRAFFLELANPNWVEPLRQARFFRSAPPFRVNDDGYVQLVPWAESQYLARMAPEVPEEVAKAILEMDEHGNAAVERNVIEAASNMPASVSKTLIGKIVKYLDEPFRALLDPLALKHLLSQLLRQSQQREASQLAEALYGPREIDQASVGTLWPEVIVGLETYWYRQTLTELVPDLVQAFGLGALRTVVRWLERWQRLSEEGNPEVRLGPSFMWRPAISERAAPEGRSISDALVDATRDTSLELIRQGNPSAEVVSILENSEYAIMERIAFHTLSHAVEDAPHNDAIELARARFLKSDSLNIGLRHEYAELGRAIIPHLTDHEFGEWQTMIASGPVMSKEELIQSIARAKGTNTDGVDEEDIRLRHRVWERDLLAAVREALPDSGQARLAELEADYGTRDRPDLPMRITGGWTGPQSPMSRVEMAAMEPADMLSYLREWTPGGDRIFGPSIEGLGRELTEVVRERPAIFDGRVQEITELDPTYVNAMTHGWELALGDRQKLPWPLVIAVMGYVAAQPDEGDAPTPAPFSSDPGWRWSQQASTRLLHKGLLADSELAPETELREHIWTIIRVLTDSPNPSVEYESEYGGDNMDPLTLSLNTVRGQAMRAAIAYLSWLRTRNVLAPELSATDLAPEVYEVLNSHLDPDQDPSVAVRSVYGEYFSFLMSASAEWSANHVTKIFGPVASGPSDNIPTLLGNVAWSSFISLHGPNRSLFDLLRDHYIRHAEDLGSDDVPKLHGARTPPGLLAEHIFFLYTQGVISLDSDDQLVRRFFDNADKSLRREVLSRLGWLLSRTDIELPDDVLARLTSFWEWRESVAEAQSATDELGAFSWWFMSRKFSEDWSITHLVIAAQSGAQMEMPGQLAEQLATFADKYANAALTVLDSLTNQNPADWQTYAVVEKSPTILAAALRNSDVRVRDRGRSVLDRLGRLGHLQLKDRVDELMSDRQAHD